MNKKKQIKKKISTLQSRDMTKRQNLRARCKLRSVKDVKKRVSLATQFLIAIRVPRGLCLPGLVKNKRDNKAT